MNMEIGILGQTKHSYPYSGINKWPLQQCMYIHVHAHTRVTHIHTQYAYIKHMYACL